MELLKRGIRRLADMVGDGRPTCSEYAAEAERLLGQILLRENVAFKIDPTSCTETLIVVHIDGVFIRLQTIDAIARGLVFFKRRVTDILLVPASQQLRILFETERTIMSSQHLQPGSAIQSLLTAESKGKDAHIAAQLIIKLPDTVNYLQYGICCTVV